MDTERTTLEYGRGGDDLRARWGVAVVVALWSVWGLGLIVLDYLLVWLRLGERPAIYNNWRAATLGWQLGEAGLMILLAGFPAAMVFVPIAFFATNPRPPRPREGWKLTGLVLLSLLMTLGVMTLVIQSQAWGHDLLWWFD